MRRSFHHRRQALARAIAGLLLALILLPPSGHAAATPGPSEESPPAAFQSQRQDAAPTFGHGSAHAGATAVDWFPRRGQLEYQIAWNGIPAANASIEIDTESLFGRTGYVVRGTAQTNSFVDLFWPFRADARTTFLAGEVTPLSFTYERSTRGVFEITWIDFDLGEEAASGVQIKKGKRRDKTIQQEVFDPISAVFHALSSRGGIGTELSYSIFTGESLYRIDLEVIGEEAVEVPAGRFAAFRVRPQIWKIREGKQPDKRIRDATIWVSRDPTRTLLRIRSSVFIGAVTLDLIRAETVPELEQISQAR